MNRIRPLSFLLPVVLSLFALAPARTARADLRFTLPFFDAARTGVELLAPAPAVPASLETAVAGDIHQAMADEALAFTRSLETGDDALAGGGAPGPDAVLAAILGFIPGFGLGHLVAGSIGGFLEWLIVDIVLGVVLFWILPLVLFPAVAIIYPLSILILIVERIGEAFSAYHTAEAGGSVTLLSPATSGPAYVSDAPRMAPNVLSLRF
ncbi:MAG: hypothetical protein ACYCWW_07425 [Deltaproteobacteria bacterium]